MRQLQKNFRLVFTGSSGGIQKSWAEYRIVDGDMSEPPVRLDLDLDEANNVDDVWQEVIDNLKTKEEL